MRSATRVHALQVALHDAARHSHSFDQSIPPLATAPRTPALSTSRGSIHTSTPQRPDDMARSLADQTTQLRLAAQALHRDVVELQTQESHSSAGMSLNDSSFQMFANEFDTVSRDIQALEDKADGAQ